MSESESERGEREGNTNLPCISCHCITNHPATPAPPAPATTNGNIGVAAQAQRPLVPLRLQYSLGDLDRRGQMSRPLISASGRFSFKAFYRCWIPGNNSISRPCTISHHVLLVCVCVCVCVRARVRAKERAGELAAYDARRLAPLLITSQTKRQTEHTARPLQTH